MEAHVALESMPLGDQRPANIHRWEIIASEVMQDEPAIHVANQLLREKEISVHTGYPPFGSGIWSEHLLIHRSGSKHTIPENGTTLPPQRHSTFLPTRINSPIRRTDTYPQTRWNPKHLPSLPVRRSLHSMHSLNHHCSMDTIYDEPLDLRLRISPPQRRLHLE